MPKYTAESYDATAVESALKEQGLSHLRVRRRADTLTIESGSAKDPIPHARLRRVAVGLWQLDMPAARRWQTTPIRAQRDEVVAILFSDFGWTLAPRE